MALIDRISFDSSGMDADKQDAFFKGIAIHKGIVDENGDLDISEPATLQTLLKEEIVKWLIVWSEQAQRREIAKSAAPLLDISDA